MRKIGAIYARDYSKSKSPLRESDINRTPEFNEDYEMEKHWRVARES